MTKIRLQAWCGLVLLLLVWGCALTGARTDRSAELLAQDYASMSDKELQTYYKQLSDQIAHVQRSTGGAKGSTGTATQPVPSGASQEAPRQTVAEDLRDRWNEVRAELSRRGLRQ
jgi:hypothetical protein